MPRRARTFVGGALLLITTLATPLGAQDTVRVGELVQVSVIRPNKVAESWCKGPVTAVEGDTLVLAASRRCPRGTYTTNIRVRVVRADSSSLLEHAGRGLLVGALVGGVIGRIVDGGGCRVAGCDLPVGVYTALGVEMGAIFGTFIGLVRAGPHWVDGEGKRPIRIGRLDLHPGLRVSSVAYGR